MYSQVVVQAQATMLTNDVNQSAAGGGRAGDDAVGVGMNHREKELLIGIDQGTDLVVGRQHRPGLPTAQLAEGVFDDSHLTADEFGEQTAVGSVTNHRVHVGPDAAGKERVTLARGVAEHCLGFQSQVLSAEDCMQLRER